MRLSKVLVQKKIGPKVVSTLYAIAWEKHVWRGRKVEVVATGVDYLNATDQQNARFLFVQSADRKRSRGLHIVSVAPAVGFHVTDNHGERLIA